MGMRGLIESHYDEDFKYLAGSRGNSVRVAILVELDQNEAGLTKHQLSSIFSAENDHWNWSVSDQTIERAVEGNGGLIQRKWVKDVSDREGDASRYVLTPLGKYILEDLEDLFTVFEISDKAVDEIGPYLDVIAASEQDANRAVIAALAESELILGADWNFSGLRQRAHEFISQADRIWGMSEVFAKPYLDNFYEYTVENDKTAELILPPYILDLIEREFPNILRETLASGNLRVHRGPEDIEFNWTITNHGVAWAQFDSQRHSAELISRSGTVQEWALGIFEDYRERSQEVTHEKLAELKQA